MVVRTTQVVCKVVVDKVVSLSDGECLGGVQTHRRQSIRRALSGILVYDAVPARASVANLQTRDLFRRECAAFVEARGVACCVAMSHLLSCCHL